MSCRACGDKGIIRLKYHDGSPDEFGVCVCSAATWYRSDVNAGRARGTFGWEIWAAQQQVDPARVARIEELLTADEMTATFPRWNEAAAAKAPVTVITNAMRTQRRPRL